MEVHIMIGFVDWTRREERRMPAAPAPASETADAVLRFDGGETVSRLDASHNVLVLGTTGSGKTASIVAPALDALCGAGFGGVVIDSKGSLTPIVHAIAAKHGREADIIEAGPYEDCVPVNLLAGRTAGEARDILEPLLLGYCSSDREGTFWHRTGLQQFMDAYAIAHDLCRKNDLPFGLHMPARMLQEPQYALNVFNRWKASLAPDDSAGHELLRRIEASSAHIIPKTAKSLEARVWQEQTTYYASAVRTGLGILQQTPGVMSRFFAPDGAPFNAERMVFDEGRIVVLRLAPDSGEAGAGLARILLREFYGAVFRRGLEQPAGRYVFCIADEWQDYVSTSPLDALNDAAFLAKCREYRCIFIGGTQSAVALSQRAAHGLDDVRAIAANVNCRIFLYGDDPETQRLAGSAAEDVRLHELTLGECLLVRYDAGARRHASSITSANGMHAALAPVLASAVRRRNVLAAAGPDDAERERELQDRLAGAADRTDVHCLVAVRRDGMALENVPEGMRTPELCMAAVRQNSAALRFVPDRLKTPELCLEAVRRKGMALRFVPEALKTPELCMAAVQRDGWAMKHVPEALKTAEFCLAAAGQNGWALEYVPETMKTLETCLTAVRQNGAALEHVPDGLKTPELCLEAVRQDGSALKFVPDRLKTAELCAEAVGQDAMAFMFVPDAMKTEDVCRAAVRRFAWLLKDLPEKLKTPAVCLEAVRQDGGMLDDVPTALKTDGLCLAAVQHDGMALEHVPDRLKTAEVCTAAVKQDGLALDFVPAALKTQELCRAAVQQDGAALKFVPDALRTAELCLEAVRQNPLAAKFIPPAPLSSPAPSGEPAPGAVRRPSSPSGEPAAAAVRRPPSPFRRSRRMRRAI